MNDSRAVDLDSFDKTRTPDTYAPASVAPLKWVAVLREAASRFDEWAYSPAALRDKARDRLREQRKQAAASNPEWRRIEEMRGGDSQFKTLLSDDLNWGHFETQLRIERRVVPTPWWLKVLNRPRHLDAYVLVGHLADAVDRLRRGWEDSDAWSMHHSLPQKVGEQLYWLAENSHGWPGNDEFPNPEDWDGALRHHARVLTTAGYGDTNRDTLLDAWSQARRKADASGLEADRTEAEKTWADMHAADAAAETAVIESLRWVADHIYALWD